MWDEYAVEPQALSEFMHLKYVVEKFGYSQGRLLSKFPSDWLRQVYTATESMPDVRRKAATVLLQRLKSDGLASFGRQFIPARSWTENAIRESEVMAFKAIISATPAEGCVPVDDVTEELVQVPLSVRVLATADNLCTPMSLLLRSEPELVFVDPYWRVGRVKTRNVMERILSVASEGKCRSLTFVCPNDQRVEDIEHVRRLLNEHFGDWVKGGFTIRACQISDDSTEDKLHARYVVGRRAGLRYDKGFDESPDERVEIGIMDRKLHEEIRDLFFDRRHPGFSTVNEVVLPTVQSHGFRFG